MIRYGLGKPREDEGGWRRAECEVGDVVVDSTTRPADARRATAFVTDSASLARTRGGTHVRDRVLVLDQQQVGTRATHQPRGHTRTGEAGSPSRRGTCGTWGMMYRAQWRRAVAPRSGAAQWRRRCPAPAAERATNFTEQACKASEQRSAASGLETGHRGRAATHVAPSAEEMHALTRCNRRGHSC